MQDAHLYIAQSRNCTRNQPNLGTITAEDSENEMHLNANANKSEQNKRNSNEMKCTNK